MTGSASKEEEKNTVFARSSSGKPTGCQHDTAREGADCHGDDEEQREKKRKESR